MNSYIRTEHIKEYIILKDKKVLEPNGQDRDHQNFQWVKI